MSETTEQRSTQPRRTMVLVLGWAATGLLGIGLLVGFLPVSSHGVSCGSAFRESDAAQVADLRDAMRADAGLNPFYDPNNSAADDCASLRSIVEIPAFVLLALAAAAAIAALVVSSNDTTDTTKRPHAPTA